MKTDCAVCEWDQDNFDGFAKLRTIKGKTLYSPSVSSYRIVQSEGPI